MVSDLQKLLFKPSPAVSTLSQDIANTFSRVAREALSKKELTDQDKVALCIAAGLPVTAKQEDPTTVTFTTPEVGFVQRDGEWMICVRQLP
jgi:hypothetical protein